MRRVKDIARVEDELRLVTDTPEGRAVQRLEEAKKGPVTISGHLTLRVKDPRGEVVQERKGLNIWTLTGREFLAELMSLSLLNPTRTGVRDDRVLYIGLGSGTTPEVAEVSALVDPVEYRVGEFLAQCQVPVTFPADTDGSPRTSVQFVREFAGNEVSLGASVVITEAGLYTDGDPNNNNSVPCPIDYASTALRAPVAYKTFEPVTKIQGYSLEVVWEVRIR
tara:strand:- start:2201 stop:2866 length:666 start_codon:yes stop_codon:yes gene_type:complete